MTGEASAQLTYRPLSGDKSDSVALLTLNRPQSANAFSGEMISELTRLLSAVAKTKNCRALVLRGAGKNFCGGADLEWMKASAKLSREQNVKEALELVGLFEKLVSLEIPTLALVRGAAFGGAVGLVACCDVALCASDARFCLSEVKVGLLPAVILPYLARRMLPGQLRRHGLSARVFSGAEALAFGLVDVVVESHGLEAALNEELSRLLTGSPEAQASFKRLYRELLDQALRQGPSTAQAIAEARTSAMGQAGLSAFFEKKSAPWVLTLGEDFSLEGH